MQKEITARYSGKCACCGQTFPKGSVIVWEGRGRSTIADHFWGNEFGRHEAAQERAAYEAEMRREDAEMARGAAHADHIRQTEAMFGPEAAAAEELAWELRDPAY